MKAIWTLLALTALMGCDAPPGLIDDGAPKHNPQLDQQSDALPFLERVHWGMNEAQVRQAVPEAEIVIEPAFDQLPARRYLYIRHLKVGNCDFTMRISPYAFRQDGLHAIDADYDGDRVEACIAETTALFRHTFGEHPFSGENSTTTVAASGKVIEQGRIPTLSWHGPFTIIWQTTTIYPDRKLLAFELQRAPGDFIQ